MPQLLKGEGEYELLSVRRGECNKFDWEFQNSKHIPPVEIRTIYYTLQIAQTIAAVLEINNISKQEWFSTIMTIHVLASKLSNNVCINPFNACPQPNSYPNRNTTVALEISGACPGGRVV